MAGRLARLLLCLALVCVGPASAAEDPAAAAVAALNAARSARGLAPVAERLELSMAAQAHADDMARRGYFGLRTSAGNALQARLTRAGYTPAHYFALLSAGYPDAALLVEGSLGDESQAAVLLDPSVGEAGIWYAAGPYRDADGRVVTHAWIIVLGRTRFEPIRNATSELLAAINRARRARGLTPVAAAAELTAAAMDHARDMVARGFVAHAAPDGSNPGDRARRRHYDYRRIGENLAAGLQSPAEVVQGWTDSPGHAEILYGAEFREVGLGYLPGPVVGESRSFGHVWVAVFGLRQ